MSVLKRFYIGIFLSEIFLGAAFCEATTTLGICHRILRRHRLVGGWFSWHVQCDFWYAGNAKYSVILFFLFHGQWFSIPHFPQDRQDLHQRFYFIPFFITRRFFFYLLPGNVKLSIKPVVPPYIPTSKPAFNCKRLSCFNFPFLLVSLVTQHVVLLAKFPSPPQPSLLGVVFTGTAVLKIPVGERWFTLCQIKGANIWILRPVFECQSRTDGSNGGWSKWL